MSADLHLHTTASDGSFSPREIVNIAVNNGLKTIAITDHDTFAAIDEAIKHAHKHSLEIIPGVELSSDVDGQDIHIIAYWPDYKAKWLNEQLKTFQKGRLNRAKLMVEKLRKNNIRITFDDVLKMANNGSIGRSHVARVMLQKGYVSSIQEAFNNYIGQDSCCYVEKPTKSPGDVLKLIKKAGGVAVFAHPGLVNAKKIIDEHMKEGLAGIEVYHPDHSNKKIISFEKLAKDYGLMATGGSDFHAEKSNRGTQIGAYYTRDDVVDKLRNLAKSTTNRHSPFATR